MLSRIGKTTFTSIPWSSVPPSCGYSTSRPRKDLSTKPNTTPIRYTNQWTVDPALTPITPKCVTSLWPLTSSFPSKWQLRISKEIRRSFRRPLVSEPFDTWSGTCRRSPTTTSSPSPPTLSPWPEVPNPIWPTDNSELLQEKKEVNNVNGRHLSTFEYKKISF